MLGVSIGSSSGSVKSSVSIEEIFGLHNEEEKGDVNLLASGDVLDEHINTLKAQINELQASIYETVSGNVTNFVGTFQYAASLRDEISVLPTQLNSIKKSQDTLFSNVINTLTEYHQLRTQSDTNEEIIQILKLLGEQYDDIQDFDRQLVLHDFVKAGEVLNRLHALSPSASLPPWGDARITAVLKDQYRARRTKFKQELLTAFRVALQPHLDTHTLVINQNLITILLGLAAYGLPELSSSLSQLADQLMKCVLLPLSKTQYTPNIKTLRLDVDNSEAWEIHCVFCGESEMETSKHTPYIQVALQVLSNLTEILTLVSKKVLEENKQFISTIGGLIWSNLVDSIITNCLADNIPEDSAQLLHYDSVVKAAQQFEQFGVDSGFISEDNIQSSGKRLSTYVQDIDTHFAAKKQRQLLSKVRKLLLHADHSTITVGGEDDNNNNNTHGVYANFPRCAVSTSTYQLCQIAHSTLAEATASSSACATYLYETTRSMFDLFRAVYLAHHRVKFNSVPQLFMLLHNDCMFISQTLEMLGAVYRPRLPAPLNMKATFVDMIPSLREMGEEAYTASVRGQVEQLLDSAAAIGGLADTHEPARAAAVETGFRRAIHQLTHISGVWKEILPQSLFISSLGFLLDALLSSLISKLQALDNIAIEESHSLHKLLSTLIRGCKALFVLPSTGEEEPISIPVAQYASNWDKFCKMTTLLEMSLAKIVEDWDMGLLAEIDPAVLHKMIKSLFSDSSHRRAALERIQ